MFQQSADTGANNRFGLICGGGRFPIMVAEGAKRAGHHVVAVGIRDLADPIIQNVVDDFHWAGIAQLGRCIRILKRASCTRAILAGSVVKTDLMYGKSGVLRILHHWPDWTSVKLWFFKMADKRNDTVLCAIADELANKGIILEECVKYTPESMATVGVMTACAPSPTQLKDIEFGWKIAKELGRLDIGQSIAVKEQDVIAVEAIEGTDRMIERAGQLCKTGGWCHIKVAKPNQDMRFDVPTVGPETIENLYRNGATLLCIEAGRTFMVDKANLLKLADKYGIVVIGHENHT